MTLRYWQPIIIPGLFQTAEYARALLLAGQTDTSDEAIGALVAGRMARRAIFDKPDPPDVVVLDEAVLHRLIGSPQVMYDQLAQVAELSVRPYICVQVVPAGNGANAGLGGAVGYRGAGGIGYWFPELRKNHMRSFSPNGLWYVPRARLVAHVRTA